MESSTVCYCGLLCVLLLSPDSNIFNSCAQAVGEKDLYERAEYYLKELKRTLEEIRSSPHHIHRRDTSGKDKIINSLTNLCSELSDLTNTTTATRTPTTTDPINVFDSVDDLSKWTKPDLFLVRVDAERDGNRVNFTFNISHTSQAFVSRLESLDFYSTFIGGRGIYDQPITSQILLSVDASKCRWDLEYFEDAFFLFGLHEDNRYMVQAVIDICNFDRVRNYTDKDGIHKTVFTQITEKSIFSQDFHLPQFRLVSDPGDEIFIQPAENPYLDVDLIIGGVFMFNLQVTMWDWESQRFITDGMHVPSQQHYYEPRNESLLSVDYLGQIAINGTDSEETIDRDREINRNIISRIRININIGSKKMSGKLILMFSTDNDYRKEKPVVKGIHGEKMILLKLPYKLSALPRNQIDEIIVGEARCNREELEELDEKCTLECYADGTDIKSIFIIKNTPYQPPVKAISYVIHGQNAQTKYDVGVPTPDKEGSYQCVVVFKNGQMKSEEINLVTTGFTEINSSLVEDLGNGTVRVTCSASGYKPLSMRIEVADHSNFFTEQLDLKFEKQRSLEVVGDLTRLTLLVSKDQLLVPNISLFCYANGDRGEQSKRVDISGVI